MKQITIKEIAQKTGYSVNTVSRALANRGEISKETAAKICKVAESLGYVPNLLARGLAGRRSNTIGFIMGDMLNPFHWPVVKVIQEELNDRGLNLVMANSRETPDGLRTAVNIMQSNQVDGLLMFFTDGGEESLRVLHSRNIPTVLIGTRSDAVPTSYVECNDVLGGYLAAMHLIQRGCRRIAFVGKKQHTVPSDSRLEGYCQALQKKGYEIDPDLLISAPPNLEGGYISAGNVDFLNCGIDGIVAYNDLLAIGIIRNLLERGIRIPEQVAIVGYDNITFGEYCYPPLTTVNIPKEQMGRKAVELIIELIEHKLNDEPDELHLELLNPKLIVRQTA
ncbi:MAG TPA: LacI family DNA-binding transcriptional regulator [Bacillota bacterium]